ncbi:MAG: hypothetical protein WEB50_16800, partial [Vicinamibacterales bacterium]
MTLLNFVPGARAAFAFVIVAALGAASSSPRASALPPRATVIESVSAAHGGERTTVTLRANGQLTPVNVEETAERPRRLVLDFADVESEAPPQTDVGGPLVRRVRIAVNSHTPLVTRVVMEIAEGATYHMVRGDAPGHDLAVVFEPRQNATAVLLSAADAVPVEPEPAITLEQALKNGAALAPPPDAAVPPPATPPQTT